MTTEQSLVERLRDDANYLDSKTDLDSIRDNIREAIERLSQSAPLAGMERIRAMIQTLALDIKLNAADFSLSDITGSGTTLRAWHAVGFSLHHNRRCHQVQGRRGVMDGITEWLCGGCGRVHGWICPYFGAPGESLRWSEARREEARPRAEMLMRQAGRDPAEWKMEADKKAKRYVFGEWNDRKPRP